MFNTKDIGEAIKYAEGIQKRSFDLKLDTKKLKFGSNGDITVTLPKEGELHMTPHAFGQVCKMLKVPGAWVSTKRELQDLPDLATALNRHVKSLVTTGLNVRAIKEEKKKYVRAVFPDNVPMLDLPDALKAIKTKLNKRVTGWHFIGIDQYCLRAFGLLTLPPSAGEGIEGHRFLKGIVPGIHITASDTGALPISGEVGIFRGVCENMAVLRDDYCFSLKRKEKVEGGLNTRFREAIDEIRAMTEEMAPILNGIVSLGACKVGEDRVACLNRGSKLLNYPKRACAELDAAWLPKQDSLFGMWNALSKRGSQLTMEGDWKMGHLLQKASGYMTRLGDPERKLLVEASTSNNDIPF